jgi:hypothetical protein
MTFEIVTGIVGIALVAIGAIGLLWLVVTVPRHEDEPVIHLADQPNHATGRPPQFLLCDRDLPDFDFNRRPGC